MKTSYWLAAAAVVVIAAAGTHRRHDGAFVLPPSETASLRDAVGGDAPDDAGAALPAENPARLKAVISGTKCVGCGDPTYNVVFAKNIKLFHGDEDGKSSYDEFLNTREAEMGFPCGSCRDDSRYIAVVGPVAEMRLTNLLSENEGKTRRVRIDLVRVGPTDIKDISVTVDAKEIAGLDDLLNLKPRFETDSSLGLPLSRALRVYLWNQILPKQGATVSEVEPINSGAEAINK